MPDFLYNAPVSSRVFLLEDDPVVAGIIRSTMEEQGFAFFHAERVGGVIEAIRRFKPDAILLDVKLPDGDGFEVCTRIQADPELSPVPVIFLTGESKVDNRLKGFAAGGRDYVPKPFSVKELVARVRAHMAVKSRQDTLAGKIEEMTLRERVRRDLTDMIVHDLRAPLGSIMITLDMIHRGKLITSDEYLRLVKNANAAAEFLLFMINDMLDLGSGKVAAKMTDLDVKAFADRLNELFGPQLKRRSMTLETELPAEAVKLTTDPSLLLRVAVNLLSNAMHISLSGAVLRLKVSPAWDRQGRARLRLEVVDKGPGVPDEEKEKIFLKNYRLDVPETRDTPGKGIGLAFCRMACDTLGGRVWVEDAPGGGSKFVVEIPDAAPHAAAPAGAGAA